MRLSDRTYKILKWLIAIVLPAFITFLGVVFEALGVAYGGTILTILAAFQTFLGTIFKTGEYRYDKDKEEARKDDIEW